MDYSAIQEQFNKVISYSQDIDNPKTDELFENWAKYKQPFYGTWADYIYESDHACTIDMNTKTRDVIHSNFINALPEETGIDFQTWLFQNKEGFFDNKTCVDYVTDKGINISAERKIAKAMRCFDLEPAILAKVQDDYAEILRQQTKIDGRLCFSVHPLDFLSLSENAHKWRSCHALDGDYRVGNTSYMQDGCTVIAYLKSEGNVKLPHFPEDVPWNNKKWRCLFFFDFNRGICWQGRQYPFESNDLIDECWHYFEKFQFFGLKNPRFYGRWRNSFDHYDNMMLNHRYITFHNDIWRLDDLMEDAPEAAHYNDLLHSSFYMPKAEIFQHSYIDWNKLTKMRIGRATTCLCCGQDITYDSDTFLCEKCHIEKNIEHDGLTRCSCCGQLVSDGDVSWDEYDDPLCADCWSDQMAMCDCCGEEKHIDNMYWDEKKQVYRCGYCERHKDDYKEFL